MERLTRSQKGEMANRVLELMKRAAQGTIPFEQTMIGLQDLIENVSATDFPTWKELEIGGILPKETLERIAKSGRETTAAARDLILNPSFIIFPEPINVKLVVVNLWQLGFTGSPTTSEVFDREKLIKLGLDLCPAEVGPRLATCYENQPSQDSLIIGMKPVLGTCGCRCVFILNGPGFVPKPTIGVYPAYKTFVWKPQTKLVFVRRKRD